MDDHELLRYSRQIMLPQIDVIGQEKLQAATVLIIGLGGLGSPVALYLAGAGVGHLILNDADSVDLTNLQRQIIHDNHKLAQLKVDSAAETLQRLNPLITISTIDKLLTEADLIERLATVSVVIDCTDQLEARLQINRAAVLTRTPLVSAAAIRWEGHISVFQPWLGENPCYHCFYGKTGGIAQTCSENGVVGPLLGVLGSLQALETLKLILGVGETLTGKVQMFDALTLQWVSFHLPRDPQCPVCSAIERSA